MYPRAQHQLGVLGAIEILDDTAFQDPAPVNPLHTHGDLVHHIVALQPSAVEFQHAPPFRDAALLRVACRRQAILPGHIVAGGIPRSIQSLHPQHINRSGPAHNVLPPRTRKS